MRDYWEESASRPWAHAPNTVWLQVIHFKIPYGVWFQMGENRGEARLITRESWGKSSEFRPLVAEWQFFKTNAFFDPGVLDAAQVELMVCAISQGQNFRLLGQMRKLAISSGVEGEFKLQRGKMRSITPLLMIFNSIPNNRKRASRKKLLVLEIIGVGDSPKLV